MPEVSVQIANRTYELACGEGEEARVQELAAYVDLECLESRSSRHSGYLLRLAKALDILRTEKPLGMVWVGQTGTSARWVPTLKC